MREGGEERERGADLTCIGRRLQDEAEEGRKEFKDEDVYTREGNKNV